MTKMNAQQGRKELILNDRPEISKCASAGEFRNWYWLEEELVSYCRENKLPSTGSKQAITNRIAGYMETGTVAKPQAPKSRSKFDWHSAKLTPQTVIADNYKNTQNVRRFMQQHMGESFKFNIAFMAWMKANAGKTLADAIVARREIAEREKVEKPAIPASNQYNRYLRDFYDANPNANVADARTCWAYKRSLPGHNRYQENDLVALKPQQ